MPNQLCSTASPWIVCVVLVLANGLEEWHPRKFNLLKENPLYDRILSQADWPHLHRLILQARELPIANRFSVACLIQGEEDIFAKEVALWHAGADVFKLTFRTRRPDALFFPNSLLAEGRNFLLGAVAREEVSEGWRYTYYCFFDADAYAENWVASWPTFEAFLRHWEPAVGLPMLEDYINIVQINFEDSPDTTSSIKDVFNFDHVVEAVHSDASHHLLPYVVDLDHECQWVSQWRFSSLANALFPGHVLMTSDVLVSNPRHAAYGRDHCLEKMHQATSQLREVAPATAEDCFVFPSSEAVQVNGRLRFMAYSSWFRSLRRRESGILLQNYSNARMALIQSCAHVPLVQAMNQEKEYSWCRGCDISVSFAMLQAIVAQGPLDSGVHWIKLGNMLAENSVLLASFKTSLVALSIGLRLIRCAIGFNVEPSEGAWEQFHGVTEAHKKFGFHLEATPATLKYIEKRSLNAAPQIFTAARAALTPVGQTRSLISEKSLERLVHMVMSCPGPPQ